MKRVGLISPRPEASALYIEWLVKHVRVARGGHHSPEYLDLGFDFAEVYANYEKFEFVVSDLEKRVRMLEASGLVEGLILANNTMHQHLDEIDTRLEVFHGPRLAAKKASGSTLLLGTKPTMEGSYYPGLLREAGAEVVVPNQAERDEIQEIQVQLARGLRHASFSDYFGELLHAYRDVETVVMGCTEMAFVVNNEVTDALLVDPVELQTKEAISFSLG